MKSKHSNRIGWTNIRSRTNFTRLSCCETFSIFKMDSNFQFISTFFPSCFTCSHLFLLLRSETTIIIFYQLFLLACYCMSAINVNSVWVPLSAIYGNVEQVWYNSNQILHPYLITERNIYWHNNSNNYRLHLLADSLFLMEAANTAAFFYSHSWCVCILWFFIHLTFAQFSALVCKASLCLKSWPIKYT